MRCKLPIAIFATLSLAACNDNQAGQADTNRTEIKVRGSEQERLHQLGAFDLAIALKRAIYDAGYSCYRVTDAGFVAAYKNLDMWMVHCESEKGPPRDWAVFTGPDGSAQVRDCKDVPASGLPACKIAKRPEGSFTELKQSGATKNAE
jgi:hypothetical protein